MQSAWDNMSQWRAIRTCSVSSVFSELIAGRGAMTHRMLVVEGIYPAVSPHFTWRGTKGQSESICPRSQGLTACPAFYFVPWHFLPPAFDSPVALPSHPLFMPNMMKGACRSSNTLVCCRVGKSIWQSLIGNIMASVFLPTCGNHLHFGPHT